MHVIQEQDRHRDVVIGRARAYRVGAGRARGRSNRPWRCSSGGNHPVVHLVTAAHRFESDVRRSTLRVAAGHMMADEVRASRWPNWPTMHWRVLDPASDNYEKYRRQRFHYCLSVYSRWVSVNLESDRVRNRRVGRTPTSGRIPRVVADGSPLVHYDADDATGYQARRSMRLIKPTRRGGRYGHAGRQRCIKSSPGHIAEQTLDILPEGIARNTDHSPLDWS